MYVFIFGVVYILTYASTSAITTSVATSIAKEGRWDDKYLLAENIDRAVRCGAVYIILSV
jgi:hypothetical protein